MANDNADSCAEIAQDVMHSDVVQTFSGPIGGIIAGGIAAEATGGTGSIPAYADGYTYGQTLVPWAAGTITYLGCLPGEIGSEYGQAIGNSLHDLLGIGQTPPSGEAPSTTPFQDSAPAYSPSWDSAGLPAFETPGPAPTAFASAPTAAYESMVSHDSFASVGHDAGSHDSGAGGVDGGVM